MQAAAAAGGGIRLGCSEDCDYSISGGESATKTPSTLLRAAKLNDTGNVIVFGPGRALACDGYHAMIQRFQVHAERTRFRPGDYY